MKALCINNEYCINTGALHGIVGKLVAFDSIEDKVILQLDADTQVTVASDLLDEMQ